MRMRAQAVSIELLRALVRDPHADQIFGEDVAGEQKIVVLLEGGERRIPPKERPEACRISRKQRLRLQICRSATLAS